MSETEILSLLDGLATRLEGPARYAFDLAVRFQIVNAVIGLVFGILLLVLPPAATILGRRRMRGDAREFATMVGGLLSGLAVLIGLAFVGVNIVSLLNPEYRALMGLIGTVR